MLNGNDFIDMLYLSEMDEKILAMRKELGVPKPIIDKDFKQYGGNSIPMEKLGIELFFEDSCKSTNDDQSLYGKGDILFGGISFAYNSKIEPPFNIKMGDSYEEVVKKIGSIQNFNNDFIEEKIWKIVNINEYVCLLYISFENDYKNVLSIQLTTYTKAVEN